MNTINTAMILAAGFGKRMGDLTQNTPKPLLKIGESTLLDLLLMKLTNAGIRRVVINLHYQSEQIIAHFQENPYPELEIIFSQEPEILGTGGGIAKARQFFADETVLICNSDVLSDMPLTEFYEYHSESGAIAAISVKPSMDYKNYSLVKYSDDRKLIGFLSRNKAPDTISRTGIFMGFYLLSPESREYLQADFSSVINTLFRKAIQDDKPVAVYQYTGQWIDIGTYNNYLRFLSACQSRKFDLKMFLR
jgi:NDP-sugar pyrophosphorylase family protein